MKTRSASYYWLTYTAAGSAAILVTLVFFALTQAPWWLSLPLQCAAAAGLWGILREHAFAHTTLSEIPEAVPGRGATTTVYCAVLGAGLMFLLVVVLSVVVIGQTKDHLCGSRAANFWVALLIDVALAAAANGVVRAELHETEEEHEVVREWWRRFHQDTARKQEEARRAEQQRAEDERRAEAESLARAERESEAREGPARREAARHRVRVYYLSRADRLLWVFGPEELDGVLREIGAAPTSREAVAAATKMCARMDCLIAQRELWQAYEAIAEQVGAFLPPWALAAAIDESMNEWSPPDRVRARVEEYRDVLAELTKKTPPAPPRKSAEPATRPAAPAPRQPSAVRREMEEAGWRARRRAADAERERRDHEEAVSRIPEFDSLMAFEKGKRIAEALDQIRRERGEPARPDAAEASP